MPFDDLIARDFGTIADLVRAHAVESPEATALIDGDRRLSYAELDAVMDRVAAGLQRDGLVSGDIIAVCGRNALAYATLFLGALRAGVAVSPLAPSSTPEAIAAMVRDCDAKLFFLDAATGEDLRRLPAPIPLPAITLDGSAHGQPFEAWLPAPGARPAPAEIAPRQAFNIIYSSGTTGEPKGIVQSFEMRWTQLFRAINLGYGRDVVTLVSTPLYSNTTLVSFFPTIGYGGTVVLMDKFDAARFLELAERHRVTHAMLVPVQYRRLMERPDFDSYDPVSYTHLDVYKRQIEPSPPRYGLFLKMRSSERHEKTRRANRGLVFRH